MLGRSLRRAALAALLGLSAMSQVRADGPTYVAPASYDRGHSIEVAGAADSNAPAPPRKRFGCWATHFGFESGTFRSESVFIFGSARAFYGEACMKSPPPPYAPGSTLPGYGTLGSRGCNCR